MWSILFSPRGDKPVVWYGTSIMHGAAASRPGLGWPQQAERMLGMEGINLGFSGNGLMQPYWAASGLITEIDASVVVIDCQYNMDNLHDPVETLNRTLVFIRALKAKRPELPVLLIEGHDHARCALCRSCLSDVLSLPILALHWHSAFVHFAASA